MKICSKCNEYKEFDKFPPKGNQCRACINKSAVIQSKNRKNKKLNKDYSEELNIQLPDLIFKICNKCKENKGISIFDKGRNTCKECNKKSSIIRNANNKLNKDSIDLKNKLNVELLEIGLKTCNMCNINKKLEDFDINRQKCKDCRKVQDKKYRKNKLELDKINKEINFEILKNMEKECINCNIIQNLNEFTENRNQCRNCRKNQQICEHSLIRCKCALCNPGIRCKHDRVKNKCYICRPELKCIHNTLIYYCSICTPTLKCQHQTFKNKCLICSPNNKHYCISCRLYQVKSDTNHLCVVCDPNRIAGQKTKELTLKTWLENNNYEFIHNKKCNLNNTCKTYYPDFLIDCNTFFLIIECDEYYHSSYPYDCERIRENNICFTLGLPCVFIRYNPDDKKINEKSKLIILKSYIDYYQNLEYSNNVVEFLFYPHKKIICNNNFDNYYESV